MTGPKREDSVKDIGSLLDWIATQPSLDKNRVLVTGVSYGGYMSYAVAEMFPDRIRCAIAGNAISDFIGYFQGTDPTRPEDRRIEYGDERDPAMRDFLIRISPLTQASKVKVPLLIVHGAKDTRVPVTQAEEMARRVRGERWDGVDHRSTPTKATYCRRRPPTTTSCSTRGSSSPSSTCSTDAPFDTPHVPSATHSLRPGRPPVPTAAGATARACARACA